MKLILNKLILLPVCLSLVTMTSFASSSHTNSVILQEAIDTNGKCFNTYSKLNKYPFIRNGYFYLSLGFTGVVGFGFLAVPAGALATVLEHNRLREMSEATKSFKYLSGKTRKPLRRAYDRFFEKFINIAEDLDMDPASTEFLTLINSALVGLVNSETLCSPDKIQHLLDISLQKAENLFTQGRRSKRRKVERMIASGEIYPTVVATEHIPEVLRAYLETSGYGL